MRAITLVSENDQGGFPSSISIPSVVFLVAPLGSVHLHIELSVYITSQVISLIILFIMEISPLLVKKIANIYPVLWLDFLSSFNAVSDEPKFSVGMNANSSVFSFIVSIFIFSLKNLY